MCSPCSSWTRIFLSNLSFKEKHRCLVWCTFRTLLNLSRLRLASASCVLASICCHVLLIPLSPLHTPPPSFDKVLPQRPFLGAVGGLGWWISPSLFANIKCLSLWRPWSNNWWKPAEQLTKDVWHNDIIHLHMVRNDLWHSQSYLLWKNREKSREQRMENWEYWKTRENWENWKKRENKVKVIAF